MGMMSGIKLLRVEMRWMMMWIPIEESRYGWMDGFQGFLVLFV